MADHLLSPAYSAEWTRDPALRDAVERNVERERVVTYHDMAALA